MEGEGAVGRVHNIYVVQFTFKKYDQESWYGGSHLFQSCIKISNKIRIRSSLSVDFKNYSGILMKSVKLDS